jgi:hypothetical protein
VRVEVAGSFLWPAGFYVIRSESEWTAFWAQRVVLSTPEPAQPEVDLSKDMVIAINIGKAGHAHGLSIYRYNPSQRHVTYVVSTPVPGRLTPATDSRLSDMAVLPRSDGNINFSFRHGRNGRPCDCICGVGEPSLPGR